MTDLTPTDTLHDPLRHLPDEVGSLRAELAEARLALRLEQGRPLPGDLAEGVEWDPARGGYIHRGGADQPYVQQRRPGRWQIRRWSEGGHPDHPGAGDLMPRLRALCWLAGQVAP